MYLICENDKFEMMQNIVNFACEFLNLSRRRFTVEILISDEMLENDQAGELLQDSEKIFFVILIAENLNSEQFLKSIFHEFVHIRQTVTGDWKYKNSRPYWKGIEVQTTDLKYHELPWEEEAFLLEKEMYQEFTKEMKWPLNTNT